eukprot:gene12307-25883_t
MNIGDQVVPAWFAPAFAAASATLVASIANQSIFRHNANTFGLQAGEAKLRRPYKTIPGFMAVPPFVAMIPPTGIPSEIAAVFAIAAPHPGKDVIPPKELPFTNTTDIELTQYEIGYLCQWYNDYFGIGQDDTTYHQCVKFRRFLNGL